MDDIEKADFESQSNEPLKPDSKVQKMFQELEILSLQSNVNKSGIDFNALSPEQMDKVLDLLKSNEDNAFKFHTKRLETIEKVHIKQIDSATINQRTIRWVALSVLFVLAVITVLLLFFKDNFFIPWLTFLTGILGGVGITKLSSGLNKQPKLGDPTSDSEDE